jgi:hypothetical protein
VFLFVEDATLDVGFGPDVEFHGEEALYFLFEERDSVGDGDEEGKLVQGDLYVMDGGVEGYFREVSGAKVGSEGFVDDLGVDASGLEDLLSVEVGVLFEGKLLLEIGDGSMSGLEVFFDFSVHLIIVDFAERSCKSMESLSELDK